MFNGYSAHCQFTVPILPTSTSYAYILSFWRQYMQINEVLIFIVYQILLIICYVTYMLVGRRKIIIAQLKIKYICSIIVVYGNKKYNIETIIYFTGTPIYMIFMKQ